MRRLDFVDSLRGVAALYVVVYHTALLPSPALFVPRWAAPIVLNGGSAVMLFFVISAFSLSHTMRAHGDEAAPLLSFYLKRFFRIAPLFYVMLLFYGFRDAFYFGVRHPASEYLRSILFVFNLSPGSEQGIVWASWTIGVEVLFYAIFPFLFARCRSLASLAALSFTALIGASVFQDLLSYLPLAEAARSSFYHTSIFRFMPIFLVGVACWMIHGRYIAERKVSRALGVALMLGAVWSYHALTQGALGTFLVDPVHWQAVIYGALLLGLAIAPITLLVNRFTLFAGRVSFSIYLLHPVVIVTLAPVYHWAEALPFSATGRFSLCLGATYAVLLPAAALTYRLIEAPGMQLGRRLPPRLLGGLDRISDRLAARSAGNPAGRLGPGLVSPAPTRPPERLPRQ